MMHPALACFDAYYDACCMSLRNKPPACTLALSVIFCAYARRSGAWGTLMPMQGWRHTHTHTHCNTAAYPAAILHAFRCT
eukprot:1154519-Pelagomonas_calceolata.AAC.3